MSTPENPLPAPVPHDGQATRYTAPPPADPDATGYASKPANEDATNYRAAPVDPDATGYTPTPTDARRSSGRRTLPCAFGDYELMEEIARGGMGVVYKARQKVGSGERFVALKMIQAGRLASPEAVERFLQEALAAATLDHPGIVPIHDVGEIDERHYFTMPLLTGGSLADLVREGPLPPLLAARLVRQVAQAVQHAHEQGIIHRDLKPANILISGAARGGETTTCTQGPPAEPSSSASKRSAADALAAKVADFGLARTRESGLSVTGEALGTPSYMPPEQARGQVKAMGPASDVYGLGAVLYCLLTGRPPFQSSDPVETMRQVCGEEPVPPRQLNPQVPRDVETICLKCLEKEPAKRYASAAAVAEDLRHWLAGEPIIARRVGQIERAVKWVRRRPVIAVLSTAVVVALVGGAAISLHFGLRAGEKEKVAVAKEKEAREALDAVEENLAIGLLRPLGHSKEETALNDFELEALEDLVRLPRDRDRVRLLFITQALEKPGTARQLGRRLEESVIAAVGLRQDLRQLILLEAATKLEEGRIPLEGRVVCARLLGELRCQESAVATRACDALSARIVQETDPDSLDALVRAFTALAGNLKPEHAAKHARILARHVVDLAVGNRRWDRPTPRERRENPELGDGQDQDSTDPEQVETLLRTLKVLANLLSDRQAAALAGHIAALAVKEETADALQVEAHAFAVLAIKLDKEYAETLAGRIAEVAGSEPGERNVLGWNTHSRLKAVTVLANMLSANEAKIQAGRIAALVAKEPNDLSDPSELLEAFAALAGKLNPASAATNAEIRARRLIDRLGGQKISTVGVSTRLAGDFELLAPLLTEQQAHALADRLVNCNRWGVFGSYRQRQGLSRAFSALAAKLTTKQVQTLSLRIIDRFDGIEQFAGSNVADVASGSQVLIRLAKHLSAMQSEALADRIIAVGVKTDDAMYLEPVTAAFAELAGKLEAEKARRQVGFLAAHIGDLAARESNPASLASLARAFAALPGKRNTAAATSLVRQLARVSHQARYSPGWEIPLDRLLPQLSTQTILETLKQPDCVGATREVLITHLAKRYKRTFTHVWELVDYLKDQAPDIDLDSPLRLKTGTPNSKG